MESGFTRILNGGVVGAIDDVQTTAGGELYVTGDGSTLTDSDTETLRADAWLASGAPTATITGDTMGVLGNDNFKTDPTSILGTGIFDQIDADTTLYDPGGAEVPSFGSIFPTPALNPTPTGSMAPPASGESFFSQVGEGLNDFLGIIDRTVEPVKDIINKFNQPSDVGPTPQPSVQATAGTTGAPVAGTPWKAGGVNMLLLLALGGLGLYLLTKGE